MPSRSSSAYFVIRKNHCSSSRDLDDRVAAPAPTVDHLLVGEHGVTTRAPVDARAPAVGQIALQHLDEEPLVPAVVVGQAGCDLAIPGIADAQTLELPLHVRDVLERPGLGMRAVLDRRVLRRQAERVPSERMEHVEAAHALHPRDDVTDHVVADVADVSVPRWVGEHLEAVELGPGEIFGDLEGALASPALLPLLLDGLRLVVRQDLEIITHANTATGRSERHSAPVPRGSPTHLASVRARPWTDRRARRTRPRGTRRAPAGRSHPL